MQANVKKNMCSQIISAPKKVNFISDSNYEC